MAEEFALTRRAVKTRRRRRRRIRLMITILVVIALGAGGYAAYRQWWQNDSPSPSQRVNEAIDQGVAAQRGGDLVAARADFDLALRLDPGNKLALYDRALVNEAESNSAAAEADYRAAITTDPKFGSALFNLAILVEREGRLREAVTLYRQAIAAAPTGADAHLNLGLLLHRLGDKKGGDDELRIAQALGAKVPGSGSATPTAAPSS
jgi:Tfp pilus assembly protein PilF